MSFPPAGPSRILLPAALCSTGVTPLPRSYGGSDSLTALLTARVSPFHVLDLPTIPPPTTPDALASLSHATPQLARPPGPSRPGLGFTFCRQARRVSGRIAFVILRTGRSSPVAPHPALRRRNYGRLQAGERLPEVNFHHSDRAHLRAHGQQVVDLREPLDLLSLSQTHESSRRHHRRPAGPENPAPSRQNRQAATRPRPRVAELTSCSSLHPGDQSVLAPATHSSTVCLSLAATSHSSLPLQFFPLALPLIPAAHLARGPSVASKRPPHCQ